jgi:uncharacterized protein YdeI (YjbR/CyaY-like superfamily)
MKKQRKLTTEDVQEIREILAEVRRCLQELIAIKKEANQTKKAPSREPT